MSRLYRVRVLCTPYSTFPSPHHLDSSTSFIVLIYTMSSDQFHVSVNEDAVEGTQSSMTCCGSSVGTTCVQSTEDDVGGIHTMSYFSANNFTPKIGVYDENHYQVPSFPRTLSTFKSPPSDGGATREVKKSDNSGYVSMDHSRVNNSIPIVRLNDETHYKVPSFTSSQSDDDSGYVPMNCSKTTNSIPNVELNSENHYKVPPFPRPLSTLKTTPFASKAVSSNIRPTLVPVKAPQVPTYFGQDSSSTTRTVRKTKTTNVSCNVCNKCTKSTGITTTASDDVNKALDELSELITYTTEEIMQCSTMPPPSSYASRWCPSPTPLVPGYVRPISNEWEDINRKLNTLVLNVKAQNKKIDDIRRVCVKNSDYVSFDDLEDLMTPSSTTPSDVDSNRISPPPPPPVTKHSTLPYVSNVNADTRTGRSWGRKLISCVKFGKKN